MRDGHTKEDYLIFQFPVILAGTSPWPDFLGLKLLFISNPAYDFDFLTYIKNYRWWYMGINDINGPITTLKIFNLQVSIIHFYNDS